MRNDFLFVIMMIIFGSKIDARWAIISFSTYRNFNIKQRTYQITFFFHAILRQRQFILILHLVTQDK